MAEEKVKKSGLTTIKALAKLILEEVKKLIAKAVSDVKADLGSALTYKGSVATYEELPSSGQVKGDTYNVAAAHGNTPAGTNYAWDGSKWDPLGGDIDLSVLATKAELQTLEGKLEDKLTEDDLEDYVQKTDMASASDNGLMSKEDFSKLSAFDSADKYLKTADLGAQFEEYTEEEIKNAISDLLSA